MLPRLSLSRNPHTHSTVSFRRALSWSHVERVWRYVKSAPLTYSWLALLLVTTIVQHSIPLRRLHALLQKDSTNLHHLASDPVRVLVQSLLWIDGQYWTPYLVVFTLFLAPAERWLGRLRWLFVGLVSHVGATYLSEGYLYWRIQEAVSSPRLIDARDIGVSYFVVGIVGVLTYRIPRRWRWMYVVGALLVFVISLAVKQDFTQLGHFSALLIGLACYPLTRSRRPVAVAA
ncbi:hypothetical protein ACVWWN_004788 [Mycobacterium sp. URHB0021]